MFLSNNSIVLMSAEDTNAIDYFKTVPGYSHKFLLRTSFKRIIKRGFIYTIVLTIISSIDLGINIIMFFHLLKSLLLFSSLIILSI